MQTSFLCTMAYNNTFTVIRKTTWYSFRGGSETERLGTYPTPEQANTALTAYWRQIAHRNEGWTRRSSHDGTFVYEADDQGHEEKVVLRIEATFVTAAPVYGDDDDNHTDDYDMTDLYGDEETEAILRQEIRREYRGRAWEDLKEDLRTEHEDELKEEIKEEMKTLDVDTHELRDQAKEEMKEDLEEILREEIKEAMREDVEEDLRVEIMAEVRQAVNKRRVHDELKEEARAHVHEAYKTKTLRLLTDNDKNRLSMQAQTEYKDSMFQKLCAQRNLVPSTTPLMTELRDVIARIVDVGLPERAAGPFAAATGPISGSATALANKLKAAKR